MHSTVVRLLHFLCEINPEKLCTVVAIRYQGSVMTTALLSHLSSIFVS